MTVLEKIAKLDKAFREIQIEMLNENPNQENFSLSLHDLEAKLNKRGLSMNDLNPSDMAILMKSLYGHSQPQ